MTVTSTNQKVQFNGNGSTTVFAYNFKIFASSDLSVILRSAAGTETVQQLTTNYTVSGVVKHLAAMSRWEQPRHQAPR